MSAWKKLAMARPAGAGFDADDVFSADIWSGTGASRSITNNIDLATEGGLVWTKRRNSNQDHYLFDTELAFSGGNSGSFSKRLKSNTTDPSGSELNALTAFNTDGFTLNSNGAVNGSSGTYVSWTWRKAATYFDIQTWTGDGTNRAISHSLGAVPEMIMVKRTNGTGDWRVYHSGLGAGYVHGPEKYTLKLNDSAAQGFGNIWNSTLPTSSTFTVANDTDVNSSGNEYVAYIFGSVDGISKCGSFVGNSSNKVIDCGFTTGARFFFVKASDSGTDWMMFDSERGYSSAEYQLYANKSGAEVSSYDSVFGDSSGFGVKYDNNTNMNVNGVNYIFYAVA